MNQVKGKDVGEIKLYAISTCIWCKKTKKLLNELNVGYEYVDMDLLDKNEREQINEIVKECNPKLSYPTLKINNDCIIGFKEEKIREAIKK